MDTIEVFDIENDFFSEYLIPISEVEGEQDVDN